MGVLLLEKTQRQLSRQWIHSLALELPLMNVVYLLTPLIWLNGLAAGVDFSTTVWSCCWASAGLSLLPRCI